MRGPINHKTSALKTSNIKHQHYHPRHSKFNHQSTSKPPLIRAIQPSISPSHRIAAINKLPLYAKQFA
jgi:hypothetical protein